jgi:hypothetical protein
MALALVLPGLGCPTLQGAPAPPQEPIEFQLKVTGDKYTITYKGKQELHQVTGTVTFICQGGFMTMPRQQLWATWKPGEEQVVVEGRAKPDQVQLDCVGHLRLVATDTTSPRDYRAVRLQAQWDGATGKKVLFVSREAGSPAGGFFAALSAGQPVALKDSEKGYQISAGPGVRSTHTVVRVAATHVVLKDLADEVEISVPLHAVKCIIRTGEARK